MESWKQRNLILQGGEGTQDRGKGKNLELMNSRCNGCGATARQAILEFQINSSVICAHENSNPRDGCRNPTPNAIFGFMLSRRVLWLKLQNGIATKWQGTRAFLIRI